MKRLWKILFPIAGLCLIGGILFCQFIYGGKTVSAGEIKEAFGYEEGSLIPIYNLGQEQKLVFDYAIDYDRTYDLDWEWDYHDWVTIHTDASCSEESQIDCYAVEDEYEGKLRLVVAPYFPTLSTTALTQRSLDSYMDSIYEDGWENYQTWWGCAPIYYICVRYDLKSHMPTELEEPVIIPFTVASESEVPKVIGIVDDRGILSLSWEPIKGASYYTIYQYYPEGTASGIYNPNHKGNETAYRDGVLWEFATTTDTTFSDFNQRGNVADEDMTVRGRSLPNQGWQNEGLEGSFFVTATVDGKESNLSEPVHTADLLLPYKLLGNYDYSSFDSIEELPGTMEVLNIDGSVMARPVYYRLHSAQEFLTVYDYQVKGTSLGGLLFVLQDEEEKAPLEIVNRTNTAYLGVNSQLNKVPSMAVKSVLAQEEALDETIGLFETVLSRTEEITKEGDTEKIPRPEEYIKIFADSAEEAWLAYALAAGEKEISLKAFPRLQNPYILEDTFLKVCSQNPYVLGVCSYDYDYERVSLRITYAYNAMERRQRQKKIHKQTEQILQEIIREDMSDEEKELAIYNWLCENCHYASGEWEQAKEQSFLKSGESKEMEDAVNAYGALVNKEALCQGYAAAFQLLGEMAGLDVMTVNGYLNGNIPHAWNMIKIEGNWYQTDCSENLETTGIPYYLYNGSFTFAKGQGYYLLSDFCLDAELDELKEQNEEQSREYYSQNGFYADSMDQVEAILERQINQPVLVFCYKGDDFSEEELVKAVRKVFLKNGLDQHLTDLSYRKINGYVVLYQNKKEK